MQSDRDKVSDRWSDVLEQRQAPGRQSWMYAIDHPRLRAAVYDTYLDGLDPFSWLRSRMATPARHALEIGCGAGDLAFALIADRYCERIDAFDIAETAIAGAQSRARAMELRTLRFHLLDGNTWSMPRNQYDFVYASHSLHHIDNLEHLFTQTAATLQQGGVFFASDYIGPSRMQYSDAHLAAMNAALATLPADKRRDRQGVVKDTIARLPIEMYLQYDPSEAVRSAEIVPLMRDAFDVQVVPMGMSLTFQVLLDIVHNFDPDDPGDNALIDRLLELEREAERSGAADTLFACLVARHKGATPAAPRTPPAPVVEATQDPPDDIHGFAALLATVAPPPVPPPAIQAVEGWMFPEAADLTRRLIHLQYALGAVTGVLELGVFKGKYLSLLASLTQGAGVPVVGVDAYIARIGEPIADTDREYARKMSVATIRAMAPDAVVPAILIAFTTDIDAPALQAQSPGGYSFISVDAGHLVEDVMHDLQLIEPLIGRHTIVAADDAFSAPMPGVTEGLFRHLLRPDRVLTPLAYAGNKLFLCHREQHAAYLAYLHWLLRDPGAPSYIVKTARRQQADAALRYAPSLFGHEIIPFDWNDPATE